MTKSTITIDHKIVINWFLISMSHAIYCPKDGGVQVAHWLGMDRSRIIRGKIFNE
jgi:hypothetical protein